MAQMVQAIVVTLETKILEYVKQSPLFSCDHGLRRMQSLTPGPAVENDKSKCPAGPVHRSWQALGYVPDHG